VKYFIFVQSLRNFLETSQNLSCQQCEGFNGAFCKTDNRAPLLVVPFAMLFELKELLAYGPLLFSALLELTIRDVNRGQKVVDPWHDVVAAFVPA
jgi:plasmid rolling circle replication initiator protein Rep